MHEEENWYQLYGRTFQNYLNWFTPQDLGNDFELVELSFEKNNTEEIINCDGFILTGGVDIHP